MMKIPMVRYDAVHAVGYVILKSRSINFILVVVVSISLIILIITLSWINGLPLLLLSSNPKDEPTSCPLAVQQARGVYADKSKSQDGGFQNVVLLTAANYGYLSMLQNWEYLVNDMGLKWAVLALDDPLYQFLGKERAVPVDARYAVGGEQKWASRGFNRMTCNKLRQVLNVMKSCHMDVLFSDCDNVFLQNPFEHDLGKLIQSQQFDYLYQPNDRVMGPRNHSCLDQGRIVSEGNTGFYYLKHDNQFFQEVMEKTLQNCSRFLNLVDDQTLFWRTYHEMAFQSQPKEEEPAQTITHCDAAQVDQIDANVGDILQQQQPPAIARLCCMDGYYYPIGDGDHPTNPTPITYHANYASGPQQKIQKLLNASANAWNESRIHLVKDEGSL